MGSRTRESLLLWKIIVVGKEDKGERRIQVFPSGIRQSALDTSRRACGDDSTEEITFHFGLEPLIPEFAVHPNTSITSAQLSPVIYSIGFG
jgi:hypothetical protein